MLSLPMPHLPTDESRAESIGLSTGGGAAGSAGDDGQFATSKWEDEEERRFYEDIQDLKDFVPKGFLGLDDKGEPVSQPDSKDEPEPVIEDPCVHPLHNIMGTNTLTGPALSLPCRGRQPPRRRRPRSKVLRRCSPLCLPTSPTPQTVR
jgi:hypothetical protein